MNTEEKAKAYDEALDRMKYVVVVPKDEKALQALKETIFPELAESEDEKIRKEINILYSDIDTCISELLKARTDKDSEAEGKALFKMEGLMVATLQDLSCIEDYLEKQKEQDGEDEEDNDFIIYHPLKNGKGEYECIPYSFYGSLTSFSEDKDLIDFLRTCFYTKEECNEWIEQQKEDEGYEAIPVESTLEYKLGFKTGKESEKQKEQKPLSTEETELNSIAFLEQLGYTCVPPGAEQKPADDEAKAIAYREYERGRESGLRDGQKYVLDNAESYGLCKPAEWSKEDNIGWDEAFACVTLAEKAAKNEEELQNAVTAEKWLKEIKFKYYVHPVKQEWSAEETKDLVHILKVLDDCYAYGKHDLSKTDHDNLTSTLKSLRPTKDCSYCAKHLEGYISGRSAAENKLLEQFGALVTPEGELHIKPRWKPSEDQMEALSDAYVEASTFKKGDILESLYNDLKKLM